MKKQQVDHVLRAASRITGEKRFIIVGSQALHGKHPDLADCIVRSAEVDLLVRGRPDRIEWLVAIGAYSPFHEEFGYYADPVSEDTATLPKGWKGRLVSLPSGDTEGARGFCLDPHDLAISKYAAFREKDLVFTRELARRGLLAKDQLLTLLERTKIADDLRARIRARIAADFEQAASG